MLDQGLQVQNLIAGYGDIIILREVNLKVNLGQSVLLLGPNGAGKTTLLKTLIGLLPTVSGSIEMNGVNMSTFPPEKRVRQRVAYMSEMGVFPNLSVLENLRVGGFFLPRNALKQQMEKMLELFPDLRRLRHHMGAELSGGQRKMLGVGKALMSQPQLLIMDEPSAGLSPKYVKEVIRILEVAKTEGLSLLIAEQNISFLEYADYGYLIEGGKIVGHDKAYALQSSDMVKKAYFGLLADEPNVPL